VGNPRSRDVLVVTARLISPPGRKMMAALGLCGILALLGLATWVAQLIHGLGITSLNCNVMWGSYTAVFIVFIAISMAGTLVSAIFRVTRAEWGYPIARLAEMITASAFIIAVIDIIYHLGRPDRIIHLLLWCRLQSLIAWEVFVISTYAVASYIYLYTTMVPDMAEILREGRVGGALASLYKVLSINWVGSEEQVKRLDSAVKVLAAMLIPTAVLFHTVASWTMGMLNRPGWHTTVMGPDFVAAAIHSAIAILLVVMWFFVRFVEGADAMITEDHFRKLGWLLFASCLALAYMKICHILTEYYAGEVLKLRVLNSLLFGEWSPVFWGFMVLSIFVPAVGLPLVLKAPGDRAVNGVFAIAVLVNIGLYLDRLYLVAAPQSLPYLPYRHIPYTPSPAEICMLLASFAGFALIYMVLVRVFPAFSVWELGGRGEGSYEILPRNPLPRLILLLAAACYGVLLYIIARFIFAPLYGPEGYVAASEIYKVSAVPVAIAVTLAWSAIIYAAYQLVKIEEVGSSWRG